MDNVTIQDCPYCDTEMLIDTDHTGDCEECHQAFFNNEGTWYVEDSEGWAKLTPSLLADLKKMGI